MKKLLSLLLAFIMVISIFTVVPINAGASAETDRITNQIKTTYAQAKSLSGRSNFTNVCPTYVKYQLIALGITSTSDTDIRGNGNQVYNNITSGTTSTGYTKTKYSGNNCLYNIVNANSGNVYNIVVSWSYQYGASYSSPGAGHVLFIHAIIDNTVYFSDNYTYSGKAEGSPLIMSLSTFMSKWNGMYGNAIGAVHFTKSHTHSYTTHSHYATEHPHYEYLKCSCGATQVNTSKIGNNSSCVQCINPIILGDSFIAYIVNSTTNKNVTGTDSNNVEIQNKNGSASQKWLFELQSDESYKITNLEYNKCMDVSSYLTANGTNIQLVASNDLAAQRFYLIYNDSGYSFAPKHCTSSVIDIADNSLDNGANVQLWEWSNNDFYQTFTIEYVDLVPRETQTYNGNTYEYYDVSMPWSQANEFCEKQGGHLVTISSAEENELVYNIAKNYDKSYCWLGATDYSSEGKWYWAKSENITYKNWTSIQPDNGEGIEHFMVMYITGDNLKKWNDISNNSAYHKNLLGFVCEYEGSSVDASSYTPTKTFEYDNKKYEIYDDTVDWHTAQALCKAKGGHLVTFKDAKENDAIFNEVQSCGKESYWLGYTDVISEGDWKAVDAPNEVITYTNWKVGEPGNGFTCEDYIFMRKTSSQWEDLKGFSFGYHNIGFICEYELEEPEILIGDTDGDGKVTIIDATEIQRHLAQLTTIIDDRLPCADTDKDGKVSIIDATQIQRFLAKLIPEL